MKAEETGKCTYTLMLLNIYSRLVLNKPGNEPNGFYLAYRC